MDRGARDDLDGLDLGEAGDQGVGHAIREELLGWIAGEILYWKYRQRFDDGPSSHQ